MAGKKTGKRLLTWVLVLVMALSLLPLNALAEDAWSTEYGWIRIYLDDATKNDLEALNGMSKQVRIVSPKYPSTKDGMRACAPRSNYWWTENNVRKVTANDITSIDLAGDKAIGSSNKISIPIQGNETYKVTVSEGYHEGITSLDSYYYLRIDISKRTPEPPKAPDAPNYDNLKTLIGDITVNCTNTEATHSDKSKTYALIEDSYTTSEVAGDAENGYTCTVTINSQKYVEQFDSDTGATHTPKDATATVTLEYKNSAWLVKSGTPISFNVVCDAAPADPKLGENFDFSANKMVVDVICETTSDHNDSYGLMNDYYTVDKKTKLSSDRWQCEITINLDKYFALYNSEHTGHTRDKEHKEATAIMRIYPTWYASSGKWIFVESGVTAAKIYVKCDATPTEYIPVTLTANSDTLVYNGMEQTLEGYTGAPEGVTFEGITATGSGTNFGEYTVNFSDGAVGKTDTTGRYIVTAVNPGTLTINKRSVTLTSETASKVYDGTPLTKPEVTVTGDGFVDGEVTDIRATGSVTNVSEGEVTNTIEYTTTDKFKADNYNITKHEGTLTITEAPTYTFDLNDPDTIKVDKKFESKYGLGSPTMRFEATVTIEKEETYTAVVDPDFPLNPNVTNNGSAVTAEPTYKEVGKATGTVTLKTGKTTKAFDFGKESEFQLESGTYRITVKETEGTDRYVNYDDETYTYEFIVDNEGKINIDTPITCTFTNKYTKRHSAATPSKPTLNTGDHYAYVMGYPDGTVRPNGSITRAEVSAILFRLLSDKTRDEYFTTESSFTDVKAGAWYNNSIATLEKAGVIVDTAKGGAFRPNEAITRAELAAMLAQFSDAKPVKGVKFSDVSAEHWAYEAIAIAAKMGWIEGYPDGTFRPDATITRAEMMTLVNRALERVPSDEDHLLSKRVMLTFPDCKSGDWFYIAVQEATNSHTYERAATEKNGDEQWTALRANRDWTLLEK